MSKNINKKIEDQDKLLDHIIEYGGKQYIDDEIEEFDQIPELELSDEFNQRMDKMFKNAYKKEVRKEHMHLARRVAAIAIVVLGIVSVTAMNVKAFREPVLNFIFKRNETNNKTQITIHHLDNSKEKYKFKYIPKGYKCTKKQHSDGNTQLVYKYSNTKKDNIYIKIQYNQSYTNYSKMIKDDYSEIKVNSQNYYFIAGSKNRLLWYHQHTIFNIISTKSESELLNIAKNIKIIKK